MRCSSRRLHRRAHVSAAAAGCSRSTACTTSPRTSPRRSRARRAARRSRTPRPSVRSARPRRRRAEPARHWPARCHAPAPAGAGPSLRDTGTGPHAATPPPRSAAQRVVTASAGRRVCSRGRALAPDAPARRSRRLEGCGFVRAMAAAACKELVGPLVARGTAGTDAALRVTLGAARSSPAALHCTARAVECDAAAANSALALLPLSLSTHRVPRPSATHPAA